jgi:hypothetical protein
MTEEEKKLYDEMCEYDLVMELNKQTHLDIVKDKVSPGLYNDILEYIKDCEWTTEFCIVDEPVGEKQEENYDNLTDVWVNQTTNGGYTGDEFAGTICIEIGENEYLKYNYSM